MYFGACKKDPTSGSRAETVGMAQSVVLTPHPLIVHRDRIKSGLCGLSPARKSGRFLLARGVYVGARREGVPPKKKKKKNKKKKTHTLHTHTHTHTHISRSLHVLNQPYFLSICLPYSVLLTNCSLSLFLNF